MSRLRGSWWRAGCTQRAKGIIKSGVQLERDLSGRPAGGRNAPHLDVEPAIDDSYAHGHELTLRLTGRELMERPAERRYRRKAPR